MLPSLEPRSRNVLLNSLSNDEYRLLEHNLAPVSFNESEVLVQANQPIEFVYFPLGGIASVHDISRDGSRVGVGIAGFEGMTGWSTILGCDRSPHEISVAIGGGRAMCISADHLISACSELPGLNKLLLRYVQCFLSQMGRTIFSNLHDPVERRLARWLLMNHDRLVGDDIHLTHEQLGVMLGVRRASVTDALHILEGERLVRTSRGSICIRNRERLVSFAGEAYGFAEAEYAAYIAPFAKPS